MLVFCFSVKAQKNAKNDNEKMNKFINNLMSKMTLEEKIGQLNLPSVGFDVTGPILSKDVNEKIRKGLVGAVFNTYTPNAVKKLQDIAVRETRLKIPLLFGYDVIHGHKTIFPIPLGLSCSWDTTLIKKTAKIAATEATADGLNWTFSPMVDIARDPRWGRVSEGAGEDPWWGSQVAKAMVQGYQGDDFNSNNTMLACVKHFALYGAVEAGRDYNTVDMSHVKMYNEYLPPYKAAVDAGVATVMTSFNEINGVPSSANKCLLTDLLRKQWNFKGFVVTDYTAISELVNHGLGDSVQVADLAMNAGSDMDMVDELYINKLPNLVKKGKVSINRINMACRLILEAKYKLGLFDNPYKYIDPARPANDIMTQDNLDIALDAAEKSIVLLKNTNGILPLNSSEKVAFIGPMVKDKRDMIGNWSAAGDWKEATSLWDALQKSPMKENILYAKGCNLLEDKNLIKKLNEQDAQISYDSVKTPDELIDEAVSIAKQSDVIVAVLGESFAMSGEAACRSNIGLPENQKKLLKYLFETGKPIVLVLMNGRPLTLQWENDNASSILETWFPGTMGGKAIANVLYGNANPSGKLTMTFPRNVGQIPIYYNHKNTGRPFDPDNKYTSKYLDVDNTPLYPFGYGLSYTTYSYSDITQSAKKLAEKNDTISFYVTVTNTGARDGEEVVQLYIRDLVGSITRPVQQLTGIQKIFLKKGEEKRVTFSLSADDLKFYNADLKYVNEPGMYDVMIGSSSANVKHASFELVP
ncbi:MAG TPA: beta-glucosidase BglX [Flavipsychrobacter sp.]|nr:beta-glucosidase BglX [Flavipsychrobacter sp.]